jgi:capsular exopolysaccharide synthesis family protein
VAENNMEFDLRKYTRLVTNWWWLLVIGIVVPTLLSYGFLSQQPDIYQCRVVLMVGTTFQSTDPGTADIGVSQALARGYAEMVRYRPVTNEVIRELGLQRSPEILAQQISTGLPPQAPLLEIYVTDTDPQMAARIANALAEALIKLSPAAQSQGEQQRFVERQLNDLKAKIEKLEGEVEEQTARLANLTSAADIKTAQDDLASLETVLSRYRSEYAQYIQSYVGGTVNQITVVEPATVPTEPKGGGKLLILGVAGISGLGLALAGIFLIEYFDDTVKWSEVRDEMLLGFSVLGGIGRMAVGKEDLLRLPNDTSLEAEGLRALRATLLLNRLRDYYQTILVTSPSSQDGKSFVSATLGISLAAAGQRVILVDGDMRKASLHQVFDVPNVFGLSDLLERTAPAAELRSLRGLQETGLPNLRLLPAGRHPLDPLMLYMSGHLPAIVEVLRDQADIVIFDTPPMLIVSDASVVAPYCDVSVLVAAHEMTTRRQVREMKKYVEEHPEFKVLGLVFNRVKVREPGSSYYYRDRVSLSRKMEKLWQRLLSSRRPAESHENDSDQFLTLSETAEKLGITKEMARRWSRSGRLPATRSGLRYWVRQSDLRTLVAWEADEPTGQVRFADDDGQEGASDIAAVVEPEDATHTQ